MKGALRQGSIPTKPRFRSVPDVMVLNSQPLTGLLIKYQRLPRGFFWNYFFASARLLAVLICERVNFAALTFIFDWERNLFINHICFVFLLLLYIPVHQYEQI